MRSDGRVVTLGMFIIDQFEYRDVSTGEVIPNHHPEQIGGGGTYAMVAARLFLHAKEVGMIVDVGDDFPQPMKAELQAYGEEMFWFRNRIDGERRTTRALNIYSAEERGFQYLTPRCRIAPSQLPASPFVDPSPPSYIHFVCGPERVTEVMKELATLEWCYVGLIWEPMPPDCKLENLAAIRACCEHMTVVSPNHLEALTLFGVVPSLSADVQRTQIEKATREIASWMKVGSTAVVRSGGDGVCFCAAGQTEARWLPAVFGKDEQDKVRDVTGGGNAFLGGLCAGLKVSGGDAYQGILYGSVAASFAIEQSGLPKLTTSAGREVWNGAETGLERLARFVKHVNSL